MPHQGGKSRSRCGLPAAPRGVHAASVGSVVARRRRGTAGIHMISEVLRKLEVASVPVATPAGRLVGASGLLLESVGCALRTGQRCSVEGDSGEWLEAQVVGFRNDVSFLMALKRTEGLATGARVLPIQERDALRIGPSWLGRVVNGLGEP